MSREKDFWRIFVVGVGGQGTLTASRVLGEAALKAGVNAQVGEIHGMAQRGGSVETSVTLGEIRSPLIGDGEADVILSLEPLEALRAMKKASPNTLVITNTKPMIPITVTLKNGQYPELEDIFSKIESYVKKLITLDASGLAKKAGSQIATNMAMLGGLIAAVALPFSVDTLKEAISEISTRYSKVNLKAFDLAMKAVK